MSDEHLRAEIKALRAENRRLNAIQEVRHDENAQKMNMALHRVAAHAGGESSLQAIQAQGASVYQPGLTSADPLAMDAAQALLQDWGLA